METAEEVVYISPWIHPFGVDDIESPKLKLVRLDMAVRAEYDLYILDKYAGWTEETWEQRFREIAHLPFNERIKDEEEYDVFMHARWRMEGRVTDTEAAVITEEYKMVRKLRWGEQELTDETKEELNQIIERLNRLAETNQTFRTYCWRLPEEYRLREQVEWELRDDADYIRILDELGRTETQEEYMTVREKRVEMENAVLERIKAREAVKKQETKSK